MIRNMSIVILCAAVVALPFIFKQESDTARWQPSDPVLVVIAPHNEAIRYEFGRGFSKWHEEHYGSPVKVDWRVIGGTSEIMRYLRAEYVAAFRAWWKTKGNTWPDGGGDMLLDRKFKPDNKPATGDPAELKAWEQKKAIHAAFRVHDDATKFSSKIDVLYGGGTYDHYVATGQGLTVAPWETAPSNLLTTADGHILIPESLSGETWRTDTFFGAAVSTFGICYNEDRLRDLGIDAPPTSWTDLTDPAYFGELGVADPTKSGSITKAFEMIIHEQCHEAVRAAGFTPEQTVEFEAAINKARPAPGGEMPPGVPQRYQDAVEQGWMNGVLLVQKIGANARYFTDGAGKVPIDVSMGNAAAGLAIDFYGRFQAEMSRGPDGAERMFYITPRGGSSVSADPISLLRGAPHRELAKRFIAYVLSEDGQKLWNYQVNTPGGPHKFALRRLPIRRDFYPSTHPPFQAAYRHHRSHTVDPLGDALIDPYQLAGEFTYHSRWTARYFGLHRKLIRAMCQDAGQELRQTWKAILRHGGPRRQPEAMRLLQRMPDQPEPLTWQTAGNMLKKHDELELMRQWTLFFRKSYREAKQAVH